MDAGIYVKFFELNDPYECNCSIEAIYKHKPDIPPKNKNGFFDYILVFVPFGMTDNLQDTLCRYASKAYDAMNNGYIFTIP
jgi:hypothetical protein